MKYQYLTPLFRIYCSGDGMFGSVKIKNRYITVFSLLCLLIFVAVCLLTLRAGAPDTVEINGESYSLRAQDEADIAAFVSACGYEIGDLLSDGEITVPKHWNETYSQYNELQRAQGFDLVPYKGKPARKTEYALADSEEVLTLLIGEQQIIAAHICGADGKNIQPLVTQ